MLLFRKKFKIFKINSNLFFKFHHKWESFLNFFWTKFGSFRSSSVKSDIALIDFCKIILLFSFFQPFNAIEFFQNKILVMLCKASNSLSNLFGFFLFYKICNMITWLQFTEECSNHPTFPCFHMRSYGRIFIIHEKIMMFNQNH